MVLEKKLSEFLNPEEVLDQLELKSDMTAVEFGCGSGGFTIPLAKRLDEGLVYAIDIQKEPLSALKGRIQLENIVNVRIIRGDVEKPEGSTLGPGSVDLVLIVNVLFQAANKNAIIAEVERVLKQGGKLLIVDWKPKVSKGPEQGRVSADDVKKTAEERGLKLEEQFEAGRYHYGLIFNK